MERITLSIALITKTYRRRSSQKSSIFSKGMGLNKQGRAPKHVEYTRVSPTTSTPMNPPKIQSAEVLNENYIRIVFSNGESKRFNINLVTSRPNYDSLKNYSYLKNIKVDPSGCSIYWDDYVDLCENELWNNGEPAP
jgi:hypothetical protein